MKTYSVYLHSLTNIHDTNSEVVRAKNETEAKEKALSMNKGFQVFETIKH